MKLAEEPQAPIFNAAIPEFISLEFDDFDPQQGVQRGTRIFGGEDEKTLVVLYFTH